MSQQINLLRAKASQAQALAPMAIAAAVGTVAVLAYGAVATRGTPRAEAELAASEARLAAAKSAIDRRVAGGSEAQVTALELEIAQLKPRADAVEQMVGSLRIGALGNPQGHSRHFSRLAGAVRDDVWVTSVEVTRSGQGVAITGRAFRNDAVLAYVSRLNEGYKADGVRFKSVEIRPEPPPAVAPGAKPPPTYVSFKVS